MSELGLVTPAGKVVWGKKTTLTISFLFVVCACLLQLQLFSFLFFFFPPELCDGCREIRTSD